MILIKCQQKDLSLTSLIQNFHNHKETEKSSMHANKIR